MRVWLLVPVLLALPGCVEPQDAAACEARPPDAPPVQATAQKEQRRGPFRLVAESATGPDRDWLFGVACVDAGTQRWTTPNCKGPWDHRVADAEGKRTVYDEQVAHCQAVTTHVVSPSQPLGTAFSWTRVVDDGAGGTRSADPGSYQWVVQFDGFGQRAEFQFPVIVE